MKTNINSLLAQIKTIFFLCLIFFSLNSHGQQQSNYNKKKVLETNILPGAYSMNDYLPLLKGKKVAVVANNTSMVKNTHLVDTLLAMGINVIKWFGPEHGFRGNQADGKEVADAVDARTGIKVISLYGNHKKPSKEDLKGIDVVLFDIQDVGARFYTYLSTLSNVMEACADSHVPLILTDRPNPNSFYMDGPVLDTAFASFVGLHPVPIVYGMTIGEYARMINGEHWIKSLDTCRLTVVKCKNYTHSFHYQLPQKPSPNLPNMSAVYLYPSLCLFEGTVMSVGRGTQHPFTIFGHPKYVSGSYCFTPKSIPGVSDNPPFKDELCYGHNLEESCNLISDHGQVELFWLIGAYNTMQLGPAFFTPYFDKLAGGPKLREQIMAGKSSDEIRKSWQPGLKAFKAIRAKYLLYGE